MRLDNKLWNLLASSPKNVCCGHSLEPSHRDGSNEGSDVKTNHNMLLKSIAFTVHCCESKQRLFKQSSLRLQFKLDSILRSGWTVNSVNVWQVLSSIPTELNDVKTNSHQNKKKS